MGLVWGLSMSMGSANSQGKPNAARCDTFIWSPA